MIYDRTGKCWPVTDFHDGWIDVVCDVIATASPEKREKIRKRVEAAVQREDSQYVVSGYVDRSRAVELKSYDWGANYLYVWFDRKGKPFYVGQAHDDTRIAQFRYKTRSEEFQNKIREGGCHSVMVAKHISSNKIDDLERNLIAYLVWKGFTLVNKRDTPSREQMIVWTTFQISKNTSEVQNRLEKYF